MGNSFLKPAPVKHWQDDPQSQWQLIFAMESLSTRWALRKVPTIFWLRVASWFGFICGSSLVLEVSHGSARSDQFNQIAASREVDGW